jgi:hypothetical protein
MQKSRKQNKNGHSRNSSVPRFDDSRSYKGQTAFKVVLPGSPQLETTTVTTGLIQNAYPLNVTNINGFSTRFASTFDEYRIVSVECKIIPIAASSGLTNFMWDEKSSAVPALSDAQERIGLRLANSNANPKSFRSMRWVAKTLDDLAFTPLGTTVTPVYFKIYTDATNYGAPVASTSLFIVEPLFTIEFKGLKSA